MKWFLAGEDIGLGDAVVFRDGLLWRARREDAEREPKEWVMPDGPIGEC